MLDSNKGDWVKGIAHWCEDDTAYLSVAFTWRLPEARKLAEGYRDQGYRVVAGGPGVFPVKIRNQWLGDVAEVPDPTDPKNWRHDTTVKHNPMSTRASYGCPAGCWFCVVPKMFGKTFTLLPDFPVRPVLCDDNLSDLPIEYQKHIVSRYKREEVPLLDANSGFEPAAFSDETRAIWQPILKGPWRFGYDEKTEGEAVERAFRVLRDVSPRRKQVYTMIGHEPFDVCMDRIRRVIEWGGEPYVQSFIKLNAIVKEPDIRHDWTPLKLRQVQRWVNRHLWRKTKFEDYDASAKTNRSQKVVNGASLPEISSCAVPKPVTYVYRNNATYPNGRRDLAEITMKINVGERVDRTALQQWLIDGVRLDDPLVGRTVATGNDTGPRSVVETPTMRHQVSENERQTDDERENQENAEDASGSDAKAADAAAIPGASATPKRGGRKTNAEKTAERLAAEQTGRPEALPDAPSAMTEAIAQAQSLPQPGMALPPGVTMPATQAAQPVAEQPKPAPTEAAMPAASAAPAGSAVTLDDFREIYRRSHMGDPAVPGSARPGKMSLLMRADAWPDGTPKRSAFTIESIPAADYDRYVAEAMMF